MSSSSWRKRFFRRLSTLFQTELVVTGNIEFAIGKIGVDRSFGNTNLSSPSQLTPDSSSGLLRVDTTLASSSVSIPPLSSTSAPRTYKSSRMGGLSTKSGLLDRCKPSPDLLLYFLHVEVDACSGLASADRGSLSDPFVIVKLNGVEFGRTATKGNTINPVWKREAFEVPVFYLQFDSVLSFEVWDMDVTQVGEFLGEVSIKLNDKLCPSVQDEQHLHLVPFCLPLAGSMNTSKQVGRNQKTTPFMYPGEFVPFHRSHVRQRCVLKRSDDEETNLKPTRDVADIESASEVLFVAGLLVVAYLAATVGLYTYAFPNKEGAFTILQSVYFGVVTFTTVGYGDLKPTTTGGKICSIFHTFGGVVLVGSGFTILLKTLVHKRLVMLADREKIDAEKALSNFENLRKEYEEEKRSNPPKGCQPENSGDEEYEHAVCNDGDGLTRRRTSNVPDIDTEIGRQRMHTAMGTLGKLGDGADAMFGDAAHRKNLMRLLYIWIVTFAVVFLGAAGGWYFEKWDFLTSVYWAMVTATSIGYGDIAPVTTSGMAMAIFYIPLSVGLMGGAVGQTSSTFMESKATSSVAKLFQNDFALDELIHARGSFVKAQDAEKVTRAEFLQFFLLLMKKVDQPLMDRLNAQFDQMDADKNGVLEKQDLELMNAKRQKLRREALIKHHEKTTTFKMIKEDCITDMSGVSTKKEFRRGPHASAKIGASISENIERSARFSFSESGGGDIELGRYDEIMGDCGEQRAASPVPSDQGSDDLDEFQDTMEYEDGNARRRESRTASSASSFFGFLNIGGKSAKANAGS